MHPNTLLQTNSKPLSFAPWFNHADTCGAA